MRPSPEAHDPYDRHGEHPGEDPADDRARAEMAALVAADSGDVPAPDLAALRAGGRRRLRRRRLATGVAAAAVAVAVAVPVAVVGDRAGSVAEEAPVATSAPEPSTSGSPAEPRTTAAPEEPRGQKARKQPDPPERGSVALPNGTRMSGEYEKRPLLGEPMPIDTIGGHQEVAYAVSQEGSPLLVGVGARVDGRLLGLYVGIGSDTVDPRDGIGLYDGSRIDHMPGRAPYYRLLGAVRGDVHVSVVGPDGIPRPVTSSSSRVAPGWTVFVDQRPWDPAWDVLKLAPLTVTTEDGRSVEVRERSWTS